MIIRPSPSLSTLRPGTRLPKPSFRRTSRRLPLRSSCFLRLYRALWDCVLSCRRRHIVWGLGGDAECPLQVYQLNRSSESLISLAFRRDVALLVSTRAPDDFLDRRHVSPSYFLTIPNIKRQPYEIRNPSKFSRFGQLQAFRGRILTTAPTLAHQDKISDTDSN